MTTPKQITARRTPRRDVVVNGSADLFVPVRGVGTSNLDDGVGFEGCRPELE